MTSDETTRAALTEIFQAGIAAADPHLAVSRALAARPLPAEAKRLILIAIGKAAHGMLAAAREALPEGPEAICLAVTNYENHREIPGLRCYAAGHPVPDENGLRAGEAVRALVESAGAGDHILALISGGGSALLPAPLDGLNLADKAEVNRLLLASGADIEETNIVRQGLSRLKGGGLLRLAAPATMRSLILSDVIGDDLRLIASGPTVAAAANAATAIAICERLGIWEQMPKAARDALQHPAHKPPLPAADAALVGSNPISVAAMAEAAQAKGFAVERIEAALTGPVTEAAEDILARAASTPPGTMLLMGGETTVVLEGDGKGGRNQELALRLALLAEGRDGAWMFLSGGTDGRDGPTDAAGALVDSGSLARMRAHGVNPEARLANSDSYVALKASGDLLMTGATGTNVADLQVFLNL